MQEVLLRPEWVAESYPIATEFINDTTIPVCWRQFASMAKATYDMENAWSEIVSTTSDQFFG